MTIEEKFEQLDKTIAELEKSDISLDESFKLYNDGMKLVKECKDEIDDVEKKVLILEEDGSMEVFE